MTYELIFHKHAEKGLKDLRHQKVLTQKLIRLFDQLGLNPTAVSGKKLLGEWEGCYSYRAGSIRIIYEIDESKKTIYILDIGSRGGVY